MKKFNVWNWHSQISSQGDKILLFFSADKGFLSLFYARRNFRMESRFRDDVATKSPRIVYIELTRNHHSLI